jgi:hypothetical protein
MAGSGDHPTVSPVSESGFRTPFVRGPVRLSSTAAARYVTQKPTLLINQGFFGH